MDPVEEKKASIAFSVFPGIGPARFRLLVSFFGNAYTAWNAPEADLARVGLPRPLLKDFIDFRNKFDCDTYSQNLQKQQIVALTLTDKQYPQALVQLSDAPIVLYVKAKKGADKIDLSKTIGVVGTRQITPYGQSVTQSLVAGLVQYGFTIVSGMALGVDAVAHRTALAHGGKTIAVLGCGVDIIAPPSNEPIYRQILSSGQGAIISEMPLGHRPGKGLFPARNRIISGLSLGVVVTEGAQDSGALITARYAADQGKEVFAVPGPVTSMFSKGPAKLLKDGATLVESAEDVVAALGFVAKPFVAKKLVGQSEDEQAVLDVLYTGSRDIDSLGKETHIPAAELATILTVLELRGIIKAVGTRTFEIT